MTANSRFFKSLMVLCGSCYMVCSQAKDETLYHDDFRDHYPMRGQSRRFARIPTTMYLPVVLIFVYVSSLTGFFRWEEKSTTSAEFVRRVNIRNRIYSPLIWLKAHDPSGATRAMIQWQYRMCHKKTFDPSSLP